MTVMGCGYGLGRKEFAAAAKIAAEAVDNLREQGQKAGVLKVHPFRP